MAGGARSRSRGGGSRGGGPGVGMASRGGAGGDSASLFDVVHGTSASRAVGGKCK
tara:strand:+ start:324 stop:488 length:165 start_codon:yes stop_codon:yes gene_type:complete